MHTIEYFLQFQQSNTFLIFTTRSLLYEFEIDSIFQNRSEDHFFIRFQYVPIMYLR